MIVIPAILPENLEDLRSKLLRVKNVAPMVQIDICDGKLTPKPTWPYDKGSKSTDTSFETILAQEDGLPMWENFDFEIDMMVREPALEYEKWIDAGASRIIFHYKEGKEEQLKEIMNATKDRNVEVGLAFNIDDDEEVLDQFQGIVDVVQLMGIRQIGFQGEPFDEAVLQKIKDVKNTYPDLPVSIDGGVNFDTAKLLADAGADRVIVGSTIFNSGDVREAVEFLKEA